MDVIEHEGRRFESGGSTVGSLDSYLNNQLTDVLVRRDVLEGDPAENIIARDHSEKVNMVVMAARIRCVARLSHGVRHCERSGQRKTGVDLSTHRLRLVAFVSKYSLYC